MVPETLGGPVSLRQAVVQNERSVSAVSNRIVLCTAGRLAVHGWRFNRTKIQAGENAAGIVWWNTRWLPLQQYQKIIKSLPSLAARQGPNGGWECATLSFPVPALGA